MHPIDDDLVRRLIAGQFPQWARLAVKRWLPRLAPHLPTRIPEVLGAGEPAHGYPWPWSVYRWLTGEHPEAGR